MRFVSQLAVALCILPLALLNVTHAFAQSTPIVIAHVTVINP
jgi:hypothetical protein